MALVNNKQVKGAFTVLVRGELAYTRDPFTCWQLPSASVAVNVDLDAATRSEEAFDEAARIIGRAVMQGVRYAARGARKWERGRLKTKPAKNKNAKAKGLLAHLRRWKP